MSFVVELGSSRTPIDLEVFKMLFENSVVRRYASYTKALQTGTITFSELIKLSRQAAIPYPLFFAPIPVVKAQINLKVKKLYQGASKQTYSLNSRSKVKLTDVELIYRDLGRKQELVKKFDPTLKQNVILGMLAKSKNELAFDAQRLLSALGLTTAQIHAAKNKAVALELLIAHLEAAQILVSRSVNGYMPQTLSKVRLSGLTVKDQKVPYIFLAGGSHDEDEEPEGRQIFTTTLLAVLVARDIFAPVTMDARATVAAPSAEYDLVSEILMPSDLLPSQDLSTLEQVRTASSFFKVTPSALVVRAMRLQLLERKAAHIYLDELAEAFRTRRSSRRRAPKPVNAIRKYNGREFSRRMISAMDQGHMTPAELCRSVCAGKISVGDIPEFRNALQ